MFTGVEVLTYAVLSNHWHLLLAVPDRIELSEKEVLRRYGVLYGLGRRGRSPWRSPWIRHGNLLTISAFRHRRGF